jgi:hypothetical protein
MLRAIPRHFPRPSWPSEDETHYLPTQYLADYCRRHEAERIEGLVFTSTQMRGGTNYALFADRWSDEECPVHLVDTYSTRVISTHIVTEAVGIAVEGVSSHAYGKKFRANVAITVTERSPDVRRARQTRGEILQLHDFTVAREGIEPPTRGISIPQHNSYL